jgi:hypothetical protein
MVGWTWIKFRKNPMEDEDVALGEHRVAFAEIARLLRDVTSGQVTLTRKVSAYTCFVLVSLMYQHR